MTAIKRPLRFLFVEDSKEDMILLTRDLKRAGLVFEHTQCTSMNDLRVKFQDTWDAVLSDYNLAGFSASDVLKLAAQMRVTAPVIVVSGAVREEDAVDLMKLGAKDFVRKDNPARFVPAILRELQETEQRRLRQSAEAALETNLELTSKILVSTQDCFFVLDLSGKVAVPSLTPNRDFFHGKEAVGRSFSDFWTRSDDRMLAEQACEMAAQGQSGQFVGLQNQSVWWSFVISPMYEGGVINKLLAVARDITEERRVQEDFRIQAIELQQALTLAESANEMKTSFLANMSHEIRTPIGAMMGFAELLTDSELSNDERAGFASVVKRNGENLLRLLNEILDLSKIEAGHLEIAHQDVSIKTLVNDTLATLFKRAEEKNLKLIVNDHLKTDVHFRTDPVRLTQILSNLLGNAIKFTEVGSVTLSFDAIHEVVDGQKRELIQFAVKDTGIGISTESQEKLFRPFSQGDNSLSRRFGGTGLGLALSKRLAEALGGDVVILRSVPGEGSEFLATVLNQNAESTKS